MLALDIFGLAAIWLYVKARLKRALELEGLLAGVRKEVRALSLELNETADRNISLVEDRLDALRGLLEEADRRMGVMRREIETRAAEREVYSHLGKRAPQASYQPAAAPRPVAAAPREEGSEAPAAGSYAAGSSGPAGAFGAAGLSGAAVPPAAPRAAEPRLDAAGEGPIRLDLARAGRAMPELRTARESVIPPRPLREEAVELYRKGFSADIIAARLGATIAEIELLVSLEERRGAAAEE
ncbi:MAG: hypothetical protein JNG85_01180 [Spirochaetaceae bacterium]|nr:hypothetical protein [Spirochaetaceae bacterium]